MPNVEDSIAKERQMIEIVHVGIGPLGQMMVRSAATRGSSASQGPWTPIRPRSAKTSASCVASDGWASPFRAVWMRPSGPVGTGCSRDHSQQLSRVRATGCPACQGEAAHRLHREELSSPGRRPGACPAHRPGRAVTTASPCIGTGVNPGFLDGLLAAAL